MSTRSYNEKLFFDNCYCHFDLSYFLACLIFYTNQSGARKIYLSELVQEYKPRAQNKVVFPYSFPRGNIIESPLWCHVRKLVWTIRHLNQNTKLSSAKRSSAFNVHSSTSKGILLQNTPTEVTPSPKNTCSINAVQNPSLLMVSFSHPPLLIARYGLNNNFLVFFNF